MDRKTLDILEFEKMQEMLAAQAVTPMGKVAAKQMVPVNVSDARTLQETGRQIIKALLKSPQPPISEVKDITSRILKAMRGTMLAPIDLLNVFEFLVVCGKISNWIGSVDAEFNELHKLREKFPKQTQLKTRLAQIVDERGEVKDTASDELLSIRKTFKIQQARLRKRAEELATQHNISQYLQEPIVTIRNGRYVLPIKQEYVSRFQGIVHDQSASGQTLFLEPSELLEIANQIKRLELRERDEIERILVEISKWIGVVGRELLEGVKALEEFDLGLAKANLAQKWNGCFPTLVDSFSLSLIKAWHPLLKSTPVPLDIELSEFNTRTVVITGPNMGGKTVALKTCGLLVAMALAGMPCPCDLNTKIGNIKGILCDIGDEQSIEQNLSTFSAHISNIKKILDSSKKGKLVIIDELGAGTDPGEGAALALSILEEIHHSGALCVVTSHYSELKIMAQQTRGMANASMEWDSINMVPTFQLTVGRPGRSHAFLVARRLGLNDRILTRAQEKIPKDVAKLEDLITDMEIESRKARESAEKAAKEYELYKQLRVEYTNKLLDLESRQKQTIKRAKQEAQSIIARARVEFEKTLRDIKKSRDKTSGELYSDAARIRKHLLKKQIELTNQPSELAQERGRVLNTEEIKPGMAVAVLGFSEPGRILETDGDEGVVVQVGALKLRTKIDQLSESKQTPQPLIETSQSSSQFAHEKACDVSQEIDLRGITRDEALIMLEKYIDDAIIASLSQVTIIHGKGSGALRKAVTEYLETLPKYVAEYRLGHPAEGGSGVTIAKLKR